MGRRASWLTVARARSLVVLAVAVLLTPCVAPAQPAVRSYRIGFLALTPGEETTLPVNALKHRLDELGYREGKNLTFDYRSAEGHADRLPRLAADLVRGQPDVVIAGFGTLTARALKEATPTIPVVFTTVGDPVGAGLVSSLSHPGGNVTGMSGLTEVGGKRLQLLQDVVPGRSAIAVLMNPDTPFAGLSLRELRIAAQTAGTRLQIVEARTAEDVPGVFDATTKARAGGMLVVDDPLMYGLRRQLGELAVKHRLPVVYGQRQYVDAGGLMSYGHDRAQVFRRAAEYVDRIVKGTRPGDLPIEQPTTFDLVINVQAAKAVGLTIPASLLLRADRVIE